MLIYLNRVDLMGHHAPRCFNTTSGRICFMHLYVFKPVLYFTAVTEDIIGLQSNADKCAEQRHKRKTTIN